MEYPQLRYATWLLRRASEEREEANLTLHRLAACRVEAGQLEQAEVLYKKLLARDGKNADWWHELGMLHCIQRQLPAAASALLQSLKLDPSAADHHYDLGTVLGRLGDPRAAIRDYLNIIGFEAPFLNPDNCELGAEASRVLLEDAASQTERSLGVTPNQPDTYQKLGHLNMVQHRLLLAVAAYESAYHLRPNDSSLARTLAAALRLHGEEGRAALLLGHAYYRERRYGKAIRELRHGLSLRQEDAAAYVELAAAFNEREEHASAIDICKMGLERYPRETGLFRQWVWALVYTNQTEDAIELAESAAEILSDPLFLVYERYLSLPIVYEAAEDIGKHRVRFIDGLRRLAQGVNVEGSDAARLVREAIYLNFHLAYQGLDDLVPQCDYGEIVHLIMRASYPDWARVRSMPPLNPDDRIRIGYIFSGNTQIDPLFLGWLAGHDPARFEIIAYQIGGNLAPPSHHFEIASDRFDHLPAELENTCQRIVADNLHILVFLYVGCDRLFSQLAALRLAPIQCAAWGHPMTTGLPTIDYFISNQAMEPNNADAHYSETLVQLPGIGISVLPPFLPPLLKTREAFGLPAGAILYFSPQVPSKYLPQYDHVFAAVAGRVPAALFVLIDHGPPQVTDILRDRLRRTFVQAGLDSERFFRFLPTQDYYSYLELIRHCDVFLDTFSWSGGLTTLDAVACALPVVTYPGEFMRGRQSYGILRQMEVFDTIATGVADYIEIAVRLGLDADRRQEIRLQMSGRRDRLYRDRTCVSALEDFYSRVARASV